MSHASPNNMARDRTLFSPFVIAKKDEKTHISWDEFLRLDTPTPLDDDIDGARQASKIQSTQITVSIPSKTQNLDALRTALTEATRASNREMMRDQLERGDFRAVALDAVKQGNVDVLRHFREAGASLCTESIGEFLLHQAVKSGHETVVRCLLAYGLDANERDHHQWTPLHYACEAGSVYIVGLLLEGGYDILSNTITTSEAVPAPVDRLLEAEKNLKATKGLSGIDASLSDPGPLHLAVRNKHSGTISSLIRSGIAVDAIDGRGLTALNYAVLLDYPFIAQILLNHGATIGYNLHLATRLSRELLLHYLVVKRPDIDVRDDQGMTALTYALDRQDFSCAFILLSYGADQFWSRSLMRHRPIPLDNRKSQPRPGDLQCKSVVFW